VDRPTGGPVRWWPSHPNGLRGLKKKFKKKKVKEEGWPIHPQGVAGHPLGHRGGSATSRPVGLEVAKPPPWPKGVVEPPLV
jgi:hypothetical protein